MKTLRGLPWLLAVSLVLAGCGGHRSTRPSHGTSHASAKQSSGGFYDDTSRPQSSRYRHSADSIPDGPPPDVSRLPQPVPKVEPRSLYGNKTPYSVLGRTYTVLPTARGYDERGIASFYGSKFHGYKTSSLEDYDMYKFTAASKVLPLPSYARVTNLQNGKSVIVRVNDRGPFHEDRVIDLSYAAAVKIGIWPKGTGLVEVQGIDPSAPPQAQTPPPLANAMPAHSPSIYLQIGAFFNPLNAQRVAGQLRVANFAPVEVSDVRIGGRLVHRVRVGPLSDVDSADRVSARIEQMGLPQPQVAVD